MNNIDIDAAVREAEAEALQELLTVATRACVLEWGAEEQVTAENAMADLAQDLLSEEQWDAVETYWYKAHTHEAANYIVSLVMKDMGHKRVLEFDPGPDPESPACGAWGYAVNGFVITDPRLSECGRFEVDPQANYGLTEAEVKLLDDANLLVDEVRNG